MAVTNTLQSVQTYNDANLAFLINSFAFINKANRKFQNFQNIPGQLGTTVGIELPPRFTTRNSLVVSFEGAEQRLATLSVNKQVSQATSFTAQEYIYNVKDYMKRFGMASMKAIGTEIEANVASEAETATYRFYGNGTTAISSYLQLASALALFRDIGAAMSDFEAFLPVTAIPNIVNSGLNQFVQNRNDRIANSWELGEFDSCNWNRSNLLPLHSSGTEGNAGSTLTVVSVTKNSDDAVTSITFSGCSAASDANSVKAYDKFQFADGVSGQPNMRFLTWIGYKVSSSPVQFRAEADAASTAGSQVTVSVYPPLKASAGKNQNINNEIVAGMQCSVLPDHRCGLIMSGNPLFLAMPNLPEEDPYKTVISTEPESGSSIRMYMGSLFGQNQRGTVHDAIYGHTLVPEYSMMIALPNNT